MGCPMCATKVRAVLNFLSPCLTSHFLFLDRVVFTAVFGRTVYLLPTRTFLNSVTSAWCALRRVSTQITFCQGQDGECGSLNAVSSFPHALTSFLRARHFPLIFKSRASFFSLSPLFLSHLLILISSPSLFLSVCLSVCLSLSLSFSSLFSPPLFLSIRLSLPLSLPSLQQVSHQMACPGDPPTSAADHTERCLGVWHDNVGDIHPLLRSAIQRSGRSSCKYPVSIWVRGHRPSVHKMSMVLARAKGVFSVDCYRRYYDFFLPESSLGTGWGQKELSPENLRSVKAYHTIPGCSHRKCTSFKNSN